MRHSADEWESIRTQMQATNCQPFEGAINGATRDLIAEVGAVWNLDALAKALPDDCDLLVQVEDELHGVPVPFLRVRGSPLWEEAEHGRADAYADKSMAMRGLPALVRGLVGDEA